MWVPAIRAPLLAAARSAGAADLAKAFICSPFPRRRSDRKSDDPAAHKAVVCAGDDRRLLLVTAAAAPATREE